MFHILTLLVPCNFLQHSIEYEKEKIVSLRRGCKNIIIRHTHALCNDFYTLQPDMSNLFEDNTISHCVVSLSEVS